MEDDLDELIDRALFEYGRAPVPAGLEARIAKCVRTSGKGKAFVFAGTVLALAAGVLVLVHPEQRTTRLELHDGQLGVPVSIYVEPLRISRVRRHRPAYRGMAKQNVFPSPSLLSREERLLIALAERSPAESAASNRAIDEPIYVEPITVVPLSVTTETGATP